MTPSYLVYGIGLLYVLMFLGLSRLRRERISLRFAAEGLCITCIFHAAVRWGGLLLHPVCFLLLLYFLTMRVRLLVEAGTVLSGWGRYEDALRVYRFGLKLFPDGPSRLITMIDMAATCLKLGRPERVIELLEPEKSAIREQLGPKHVAAAFFNLGMAYRRSGRPDDALRSFAEAEHAFPLSKYAVFARKALDETRKETGRIPSVPEGG